ncbi:MAG: VWA domain-containing protein, partial [Proteobacteria bacterium]|nr:VWA domain-containing protein [Pseudomonadota bacterium]
MERTLSNFIRALRNAEVRVSTAETLDAFNTMELVGYRDRAFLKDALSMVLPKTADEKESFSQCFDSFFSFKKFDTDPPNDADEATDGANDSNEGREADEGEDAEGGQGAEGRGAGAGGGGRKSKRKGAVNDDEDEDLGEGEMSAPTSNLGKLLIAGARTDLAMARASAAEAVNLKEFQVFTQKGLYTRRIMEAMGLNDMAREISGLRQSRSTPDRRLGQELKKRREWLREQVRDYVEQQFLLHADSTGRRLREDLLRRVKLSNVEQRNFRLIQEVVFRMAKKLAALHSRRKKVFKRGALNVPRTLRHNMAYDGAIFDLHWKSVKIDRPKVFAICDVSGSVANYARFMLMFLYSLEEVMPKVRSFAFSSDLAEVTELFERNKIEDAIAKALRDYGGGSTDYGQAFVDFKKNCLDDVDNR